MFTQCVSSRETLAHLDIRWTHSQQTPPERDRRLLIAARRRRFRASSQRDLDVAFLAPLRSLC
jgi:hypothetical protein